MSGIPDDMVLYAWWKKSRSEDDDDDNGETVKPSAVSPDTIEGYFTVDGRIQHPDTLKGKPGMGRWITGRAIQSSEPYIQRIVVYF